MKARRYAITAGAFLVAGLASYGIGAAGAKESGPPPIPWYRADGTLDRSKLPACLPIYDEKGNFKKDKQGKEICIPTSELYPLEGEDKAKPEKVKKRYVDADGREIVEIESEEFGTP